MKVRYAPLPSGIEHTLQRDDVKRLGEVIPSDILKRVKSIDLYYNADTTLRARISFRGSDLYIKLNFCLVDGRSPLRRHRSKEIPFLRSLGATVDSRAGQITWTKEGARKYALFMLLHELSHVMFGQAYPETAGNKYGSPFEEDWCDEKAKEMLQALSI